MRVATTTIVVALCSFGLLAQSGVQHDHVGPEGPGPRNGVVRGAGLSDGFQVVLGAHEQRKAGPCRRPIVDDEDTDDQAKSARSPTRSSLLVASVSEFGQRAGQADVSRSVGICAAYRDCGRTKHIVPGSNGPAAVALGNPCGT